MNTCEICNVSYVPRGFASIMDDRATIHRCEPNWIVWCEEDGQSMDDANAVGAFCATSAAEKWAEIDDAGGDYNIIKGGDAKVNVRHATGTKIYTFSVRGESLPQYTATEI